MVSVTAMAQELQRKVRGQQTPIPYEQSDYEQMILDGIRKLYVLTEREKDYSEKNIRHRKKGVFYRADFSPTQKEFILTCARIAFLEETEMTVSAAVGYTTPVLTVTNADKPAANLHNMLLDLRAYQQELFHKLCPYAVLSAAEVE